MPSARPWRAEHEVRLDAVGLVRPGTVSRTTSGKTDCVDCRQRFAAGQLEFIELWKSPLGNGSATPIADAQDETAPVLPATAASLVDWITAWLARRLELAPGEIDTRQPLAVYGLDSLLAVELMHDVEQVFGHQLDVGVLVDAPSIAVLAEQLTGEMPRLVDTAEAAPPGIVRPTYHGPFGDRPDGILVRGESAMREMMPYLMRRRNESVVYHEASYDVTAALEWLEAYNRRHTEARATLLDLFLWAAAYVGHVRPGLNRFISGRRIYQRREVAISFAAKKRYDLAAELVTVKLTFPEKAAPFSDCVQRIAAAVDRACHGAPRAVDRETELAMRLPRWLLRTVLWGYRRSRPLQSPARKTHRKRPTLRNIVCRQPGLLGIGQCDASFIRTRHLQLVRGIGFAEKNARDDRRRSAGRRTRSGQYAGLWMSELSMVFIARLPSAPEVDLGKPGRLRPGRAAS